MEPQPQPAGRTRTVGISGLAFIGELETAAEEVYAKEPGDPDVLIIDLSDVTFTEPPALQYIIALARARKLRGLSTRLKLPSGDTGSIVRDFLRRWHFPKAFADVTGIRFLDFVDPKDHQYFKGLGGDRLPSRYAEGRATIGSPIEAQLDAPRFFPFTTWSLAEYSEKARVSDEALEEWSDELVQSVLDRNLQQKDQETKSAPTSSGMYVASRIVFEAMTNAIRHPGASFIQSSSVLRSPTSRWTPQFPPGAEASENVRPNEHFAVTFWDDGTPMTDTLKSAISNHLSIRHSYPTALDTKYRLTIIRSDDEGGSEECMLVDSSETPDSGTPHHRLLLATIFPGVTCDVTGKGLRVHPELAETEPTLATQGMGLFALVRTAIDKFGGSVAIRTGPYFMSVKRALRTDREAHYRVKIEVRRETTPLFLGNMITVRLPLKRH